jgi:molecular chaperone DnaK
MRDEAAANAESDKQAKEKVEKLNNTDSLIFQTEKQLKDFGEKIPADKKGQIDAALAKLKEAYKVQDMEGIEKASAELNTVFQAASQEMYNAAGAQGQGGQAGPQGGGSQQQGPKGDGDVTDVDFEEVK